MRSVENVIRKPGADDPFEAVLISERPGADEWIVACTSIPHGDFEERVYAVVDTEGDAAAIVIYRISNPWGKFRIVRQNIMPVDQFCADAIPADARMLFRAPTKHLALDAALNSFLDANVGIVYSTGVAKEAFFFARTSGIGRVDDVVAAHVSWVGSDKAFERHGREGMRAYEIGDGVRVEVLMRKDIDAFANEVNDLRRGRLPSP